MCYLQCSVGGGFLCHVTCFRRASLGLASVSSAVVLTLLPLPVCSRDWPSEEVPTSSTALPTTAQ